MSFRQLAWNNVKRNSRAYAAYFLSSTFSVMIFFSYAVFMFHPELKKTEMGQTAQVGMKTGEYVIFFFSLLFVLYSISAFLKARKKEFGILTILGAERRQVNGIVFFENMIIGFAAIVMGTVMGLICSKLFLLFASTMTGIDNLPFYLPVKAIILTFACFFGLFLGISIMTILFLRQQQALELLLGNSKPKKEPKLSILLAFVCIISFVGSFYLMFHDLGKTYLYVLGLGSIGTYFFFTQLSVFSIRLLKKRRSFFRKGINMLWISEMAYKMKDNARMFFIITVVTAMACGFVSLIVSMGNETRDLYRKNPYAITYTPFNEQDQENWKKDIEEIDQQLESVGVKYEKHVQHSLQYTFKETSFTVMKASDYNRYAADYGLSTISVKNHEAITIFNSKNIAQLHNDSKKAVEHQQSLSKLTAKSTSFKIAGIEEISLLDRFGFSSLCVLSDEDFNRLAASLTKEEQGMDLSVLINYYIPSWENNQLPTEKSEEIMITKRIPETVVHGDTGYAMLRGLHYLEAEQMYRLIQFIFLFIAILFSLSTVSFLYFKLYTDLQQDQKIYHSLSKIGLSQKEMNRAATIQMFVLFFLPLIVAAIGTLVTVAIIQGQVGLTVTFSPSLIAVGAFGAAQVLYFIFVRILYLRQLNRVMV
ncbi:ABC transporter permease [Heyndrickxia oleronia]|uniref:FtsX-like permease family protein n=1 Tax=Heyndrickxia oleronia TaxID=38875 RepID=UPI00203A7A22|nr:ABC transporter permease [Heyndrickxia oleronia]MCM3240144.1 ABC transporter permease [Heyndrickxia oleronia]